MSSFVTFLLWLMGFHGPAHSEGAAGRNGIEIFPCGTQSEVPATTEPEGTPKGDRGGPHIINSI
jgi:hypothetical protein